MISSWFYVYSSHVIPDMMPLTIYIKSVLSRSVQSPQNNDNSINQPICTNFDFL